MSQLKTINSQRGPTRSQHVSEGPSTVLYIPDWASTTQPWPSITSQKTSVTSSITYLNSNTRYYSYYNIDSSSTYLAGPSWTLVRRPPSDSSLPVGKNAAIRVCVRACVLWWLFFYIARRCSPIGVEVVPHRVSSNETVGLLAQRREQERAGKILQARMERE